MLTKILKFLGLLVAMAAINCYVPYGLYINGLIQLVALWCLVNSGKSK